MTWLIVVLVIALVCEGVGAYCAMKKHIASDLSKPFEVPDTLGARAAVEHLHRRLFWLGPWGRLRFPSGGSLRPIKAEIVWRFPRMAETVGFGSRAIGRLLLGIAVVVYYSIHGSFPWT